MDPIPPQNLKALVLAGGESRRMGKDKALLHYHSVPQLHFITQLLKQHLDEVFVSCHPQRMHEVGYPIIKDVFFELGPMGGVLSAFQQDPNSAWLVVACDMPLIDAELIQSLISQRDPGAMATCFIDAETALPEPLFVIWEPKAFTMLKDFLEAGNYSLRKALLDFPVKKILPDSFNKLRNINTPEEATQMLEFIRKSEG